jgi:hypothetical protein
MGRSKKSQSKHDAAVRRAAKEYQGKGYDVAADVPGFPTPKTIGGKRPDVVAKKGSERKIVEVETPDSVGSSRDVAQQQAFKRTADRSKATSFKRIITG